MSLRWKRWSPVPNGDSGMSTVSPERLRGFDGDPAVLRDKTAIVLGLGAVGGIVLQMLAQHRVGTLIAADPDCYGPDSHYTQPALPADAGRAKAWVQAERAYAINPAGEVLAAVGFGQDLPLCLLRRAHVIVAAPDNRELLVWAGQVATGLGIPLVQGAVHGESWTAFARGWALADPEAACPACMMNRDELRRLGTRFGCDPATARVQGQEPTRTLPVVCATAGSLAAAEALKWLLGLDRQALAGEEVAYCLRTHRAWRTTLPRNPACPGRHRRWRLEDIAAPLTEVTPAMLADRLGHPADGLQVRSELPWISFALCPACARRNEVRRFARLGDGVGRCPCGAELSAGPVGKNVVLPAADLRACWDMPLANLGLGTGAALGLSAGEDWTYFFAAGETMSWEDRHD